jgi:hypothetical protein
MKKRNRSSKRKMNRAILSFIPHGQRKMRQRNGRTSGRFLSISDMSWVLEKQDLALEFFLTWILIASNGFDELFYRNLS